MSLEDLREALKPLPAFRAKQIFRWLTRGVRSFSDMTDLSFVVREALEKRFSLYSSVISQRLSGEDGAVKIRLALEDGCTIESALLSDGKERKTACISTQVGCAMGCVFCKTGANGFRRNATAGEIIEQFLHLRSIAAFSNVVIMGMGEPLLNLSALREALAFIAGGGVSRDASGGVGGGVSRDASGGVSCTAGGGVSGTSGGGVSGVSRDAGGGVSGGGVSGVSRDASGDTGSGVSRGANGGVSGVSRDASGDTGSGVSRDANGGGVSGVSRDASGDTGSGVSRGASGGVSGVAGESISKRRITVSTSGIIAGIHDLADNGPDIRLAVSLTTADEMLREKLMPVTRTNPLPLLKKALAYYQRKNPKRITLEMTLLRNINTSRKHADLAAEFAQGLDVVINVIPWNPVAGLHLEGVPLQEPDKAEVERFIAALQRKGMNVTTRYKKGRDIAGACGQLG